MATVKKGLTPYRMKSGAPFTGGRTRFLIKNGTAAAIGAGDPVKVSNGFIEVVASGAADRTGVFAGCRYVDANGQVQESSIFPAGVSSAGELEGETHALGYVYNDPDMTYVAEADGAIAATLVGGLFRVSVGTPDTVTKRSTVRVHASAQASVGAAMVRVLGFPNIAGTRPGDANTIVEVELINPALIQG